MTQVIPKVILVSFGGDDSEASKYRGWMAAGVSVIQLLFVPALSGCSDAVGRRALIGSALALHAGSVFVLAATVGSAGALAWATACRLVTSLSIVIIPVSQAVMIDLSTDGGKGATHGLGIAFGAFALGNSAGDIVGGFLSEHHRGVACFVSGALGLVALLSLLLLGWEETAPSVRERGRRRPHRRKRWGGGWWCRTEKREEGPGRGPAEHGASDAGGGKDASGGVGQSGINDNGESGGGGGGGETASAIDDNNCLVEDGEEGLGERNGGTGRAAVRPVNPISVLKVFLESRVLLRIACSYFLFVLSLNVFATGYNYVDYRFHWTTVEISYFFATYNICMGLGGGLAIRGIVPKRLSEENGGLFGIFVQVCAVTVSGLCFRGWMLYPALAFGALQNITEPCLQAVMATFVEADRQGSLQGAVMSLRVVGEGVAAPLFTQVFSAGSSAGFEEAPFFLATAISLVSLAVAWRPLRRLSNTNKVAASGDGDTPTVQPPAPAVAPAFASAVAPASEGWVAAGRGDRSDNGFAAVVEWKAGEASRGEEQQEEAKEEVKETTQAVAAAAAAAGGVGDAHSPKASVN